MYACTYVALMRTYTYKHEWWLLLLITKESTDKTYFFQDLISCGVTLKPSSTLSKRSLNEHLTIKHKKSIGVPYVGINASFFEKKLDLLDGNAVKISKFIRKFSI